MKPLKNENVKDLAEKVLDLIAKTSVEIGHKTDPQTMATLSKIFANDLINMAFSSMNNLSIESFELTKHLKVLLGEIFISPLICLMLRIKS